MKENAFQDIIFLVTGETMSTNLLKILYMISNYNS